MTSGTELIIHLKDPHVDVEISDNQLRKSQLKFCPVLNVISTHWDRNITELENTLGTTLGRVDDITCCLVGFTTHNRNTKLDWQLDVIFSNFAWYYICLLAVDKVLNLTQGFWWVKHSLGQTKMLMEAHVVFRDNQVEPFGRLFDLNKLQDLHVVLIDFACQCVWTNVNYINFRIFHREDSCDLCVFLLLELFNSHTFHLGDWERI